MAVNLEMSKNPLRTLLIISKFDKNLIRPLNYNFYYRNLCSAKSRQSLMISQQVNSAHGPPSAQKPTHAKMDFKSMKSIAE